MKRLIAEMTQKKKVRVATPDNERIKEAGERRAAIACFYRMPSEHVERERGLGMLEELSRMEQEYKDKVLDARFRSQRPLTSSNKKRRDGALIDKFVRHLMPQISSLNPADARTVIFEKLIDNLDTFSTYKSCRTLQSPNDFCPKEIADAKAEVQKLISRSYSRVKKSSHADRRANKRQH